MQNIKNITRFLEVLLFVFPVCLSQSSCKKYLDAKQNESQTIPSTLKDLQALLDQSGMYSSAPSYAEFVSDNYYVTTASWNTVPEVEWRLGYIWDANAKGYNVTWINPYNSIYYANVVLDYLPGVKVDASDITIADQIKGSALFYRSFQFYQLAQVFCKPYTSSAGTDMGIVLRTASAIETPSERSTVQQTYDRLIADLKTAAELLPVKAASATRPNKAAAFGLLARTYLSMREYDQALVYAEKALQVNNSLLDYNALIPANQPVLPFFTTNPEIQVASVQTFASILLMSPSHTRIDSSLYKSYNVNDLRRSVFFRTSGNTQYWWGSYFNGPTLESFVFDGIANDELYLIRAECRARAGNVTDALNDLNTLLRNRWKTGTYSDFTTNDPAVALAWILEERRKELLFRGLRWSDLRRFNLEGANITLKRIINNTTYTLPPNDLRWTLLIPDIEINRSGIPQNPR
jgi:starch-binding outer membrane protein, SusD/RagB family